MSPDEIRSTVLRLLGEIAPEADLSRIDTSRDLRDQLDLDSMDLLNFVVAVDHELRIEIPERDYPQLTTLDVFVDYLAQRAAAPA